MELNLLFKLFQSASSASGRKVSPAQVQLALQMHMPNSRACNFAPGQRVFANTFSANVAGADLARQLCFLESGEVRITLGRIDLYVCFI
jgi:hypothetical protein